MEIDDDTWEAVTQVVGELKPSQALEIYQVLRTPRALRAFKVQIARLIADSMAPDAFAALPDGLAEDLASELEER